MDPTRRSKSVSIIVDARLGALDFGDADPAGNELFICVYDGTIEGVNKRGNRCTAEAPTIILFEGDGDVIVAAGRGGANILYCEGRPINEPVVKYGPFVMNTREEVQKAVEDFNSGRLVNV